MELTRAQILKKFDIKIQTLELLQDMRILEGGFESKDGKRVINLSKHDVFVLECSRCSISSFGHGSVSNGNFKGVHTLPFHRFLTLRFLNTPVEEIHDEIFQLGLLESEKRFQLKDLKALHKRFISRVPTSLRKVVQKGAAPKSKKDKALYDIFLRVMNVRSFYEDPELFDQLFFFIKMRKQVETFLSTQSKSTEIAIFLSDYLGTKISHLYVNAYRVLMYSIHELREEDKLYYFYMVPPSERKLKKTAMQKSIDEYAIVQGLESKNVQRILEEIRRDAQREIFNLRGLKTQEAQQSLRAAVDRFLKADERLEDLGADIVDVTRIFDRFKIRKSRQDVISIEEARERLTAEEG